mgnify:CR=1 FL=1
MLIWDSRQPFEMTAWQALKLLRRQGMASREEARQMRAVLREDAPVPPTLHPLCQRLWLAQVPPVTRSLH